MLASVSVSASVIQRSSAQPRGRAGGVKFQVTCSSGLLSLCSVSAGAGSPQANGASRARCASCSSRCGATSSSR